MAMNPGPDMDHDPQLTEIYREGAQAGPPARCDETIRAAARREVKAGPHRGGLRRWQLPLSLAAVLVLSVTVVTQMREQGADRPEALLSPLPAEAPPLAAEQSRTDALLPPAAVPETGDRRRDKPAPAPDRPAAPVSEMPAQAPPPAMASEQKMMAAPAESRAAPADAAREVAEDAARARSERQAPRPLLRSAPPAPLADPPAGSSAAAPARPAVQAVPEPALLWRDLLAAPAEKWIERIVELRRAGKTADVDALAAEFGRRFPDQQLPAEAR